MEKYAVHPNRVNMDCPRVVVSTVTFKTGCDVCMVEKWLSFYRLGESGVSLCGSSCRQQSSAGGLGPEVIMVSAGTCLLLTHIDLAPTTMRAILGDPSCPWQPDLLEKQNAWASAPHKCFQQLMLGLLRGTVPAAWEAFPWWHFRTSLCLGILSFSPAQTCFQGSSTVSVHVCLDGPFGVPSCCAPPRTESSLCSPCLTMLCVPKTFISGKCPKHPINSAKVLWPLLLIFRQLPRLPACGKGLG